MPPLEEVAAGDDLVVAGNERSDFRQMLSDVTGALVSPPDAMPVSAPAAQPPHVVDTQVTGGDAGESEAPE